MRAAQARAKRPPGYDGLCRGISREESDIRAGNEAFVVRFAMKQTGTTILEDAIRGSVRFDNSLQSDFVILKSDGYPTYHLAFIVDDVEMEITHVVRGDEWISSAPKHVQIYEALGWELPVFAHLPLILGPNQKKLSKRDGDVALLDYRTNGYLPEAIINFLAFLGWSLDDKTSHITLDEFAEVFSLDRVVPNPAVFDIERLDSLNGHYIREMEDSRWQSIVAAHVERDLPAHIERPVDQGLVVRMAELLKERVTNLNSIPGMVEFLFGPDAPEYSHDLLAARIGGDLHESIRILDAVLVALDAIDEPSWTVETIESSIRGVGDTVDLKLRKFVPTLYAATMGSLQGIPLFDSMEILGRDRTLGRLRKARALADHHK